MLRRVVQSKSKSFLAWCLSFLLGVALVSLVDRQIYLVYIYVGLFVSISFLVIFWKNRLWRFLFLCVVLFIFGVGRYLVSFPIGDNYISAFNGEEKQFTAYVAAEPDVRLDGVRYTLKIISLKSKIINQNTKMQGRVYVKSELYPRYVYGDVLEVRCKLQAPEPIEDFRYDRYLARFGVFSVCWEADMEKIGEGKGNAAMRGILSIKNIVAEKINLLWHEPHASFMAGLLYGYRGGLGSLNELFNITGVTHIIAISGYNIAIVAAILLSLCIHLYIPRKKAFWFVVLGIVVFVLFAGASASVVRAGIMGILVLLAKQMGRMSRVGNVMALTAVVMVLHNPFVLVWDAGFQLSFVATMGLVYLTSLVEKFFGWVPETIGLRESVVSTFAAIIATLPLILYQFGRLSLVAPIVNVLILWLIPFLMMFGFVAVIVSFLFMPLAKVVAWVAWVGLSYIIEVVTWFAGLPFAAVDFRVSWWMMIFLYVGMIYFLRKNTKINI